MDHSIPTHDPQPADPRPDGRDQVAQLERQLRASSASRSTAGRPRPGHRPRHRAGAGPDAARHDDRLRRLATPRPTARSARSRSASARARSRWCSRRSALLQRKPKTYEVRVDGRLEPGRTAKDIILALIAQIGIGGGTGHVFEYTRRRRSAALTMEERMTICNMSIEGGARAGLIAPDETTFEYLAGRPHAPKGADWDAAVARWRDAAHRRGRDLRRDDHDRRAAPGADDHLRHQPRHGHAHHGRVPTPTTWTTGASARARARRSSTWTSQPGQALARPAGGRRVHRLVHELAASPTCALAAAVLQRPAGRRRRARDGRARAREEVKRQAERGGPRRGLPRGRRRVARGRLLDVHRDERRPAGARPVRDQHAATATSRAARARAAGRSWPAR